MYKAIFNCERGKPGAISWWEDAINIILTSKSVNTEYINLVKDLGFALVFYSVDLSCIDLFLGQYYIHTSNLKPGVVFHGCLQDFFQAWRCALQTTTPPPNGSLSSSYTAYATYTVQFWRQATQKLTVYPSLPPPPRTLYLAVLVRIQLRRNLPSTWKLQFTVTHV